MLFIVIAVFNTDTNHSVVQTYNFTTYKECDYNDALDSDTKLWSAADPSNTATSGVTVPVPLLKEGTTYFFSSDYDGDQCRNGKGLPESLKSPSEQSPAPNSADYNNDESAPDLVVPSTFNKPRGNQNSNDDDDDVYKKKLLVGLENKKPEGFRVVKLVGHVLNFNKSTSSQICNFDYKLELNQRITSSTIINPYVSMILNPAFVTQNCLFHCFFFSPFPFFLNPIP